MPALRGGREKHLLKSCGLHRLHKERGAGLLCVSTENRIIEASHRHQRHRRMQIAGEIEAMETVELSDSHIDQQGLRFDSSQELCTRGFELVERQSTQPPTAN